MISEHGSLYIKNRPAGAKRGHLFVVRSRDTISGTDDRRRVGLVRGSQTHERSLEVFEVCHIPARERPGLAPPGLIVVPLAEDTRARIERCIAQYSLPPAEWDRSSPFVDLELDVGLGDGVREGDRYEIQGAPIADSLNQTVTGFETLGQCVVQRVLGQGTTRCRLDRGQWPEFTRDRGITGGYAILMPPSGERRP